MKAVKRILLAVLIVFVLAVVAFGITAAVLCIKNPNPDRPSEIDNHTGFVQTYGRNFYDGNGKLLQFKGVNLGNWFVQEPWMTVSEIGDFDTGVYTDVRGLAAMKQNPNLTDEQIDELRKLYIDTYIQEGDFKNIADLGLNCVRINFTYMNLTTDGRTLRENAFDKLDWALDMCEKYGLYAILDLHGAVGSQNMDNHSGTDADWDLYPNEEHRAWTIELWKAVAQRYKDRTVVAAYDLLNEPRSAPGKYAGKEQFDFYDELYNAVRAVDANHVIIMECFTFPTHGVSEKEYNWENVAYSYHIYNQTPLPQSVCLYFYKALHNLKGYDVPIIVGEWSCWGKAEDWQASMDFFDDLGWSYCSWTYKTNNTNYGGFMPDYMVDWGIYELSQPMIDLSTATYEEIAQAYSALGTENAKTATAYDVYKQRFGK